MLVCLWVFYFICWSPLETMLLFMEYTDKFPTWWPEIEWISYFMAYFNTAINPYIYAWMSENYKHGFQRMRDKLLRRSHFGNSKELKNTIAAIQLTHKPRYYRVIRQSLKSDFHSSTKRTHLDEFS